MSVLPSSLSVNPEHLDLINYLIKTISPLPQQKIDVSRVNVELTSRFRNLQQGAGWLKKIIASYPNLFLSQFGRNGVWIIRLLHNQPSVMNSYKADNNITTGTFLILRLVLKANTQMSK